MEEALAGMQLVAAPAASVPTVPAVAAANAAHMAYIKECVDKIQSHPVFQGVDRQSPLTLAQGGKFAPLDFGAAQKTLANSASQSVSGGGNLFWIDLGLDAAVSHTPVKTRKCREIADRFFAQPRHLASEITVGVPMAWANAKGKQKPSPGCLRRVSPAEPIHALLMAVARDVEAEELEKLDGWKEILLSCLVTFQIVETDTVCHHLNTQLREKAGIEHELIRHSALSRVLDVTNFSQRLQRGSNAPKQSKKASWPKMISEAYNADLILSELSEKVTESWVERALSVSSRMLKSSYILEKLLYLDDNYGASGPLDSVHKLHALLGKVGSGGGIKKMEWLVGLLVDLFDHQALEQDSCTKRELSGATGNKGLADVILCKLDVKEELFRWAETAGIDSAALQKIKEVSSSLEVFRQHCGHSWIPAKVPPAPWRASFCTSSDLFLNLIESLVFSVDFDDCLLSWLRSKKSLADCLKTSPLSEALEEIQNKVEE